MRRCPPIWVYYGFWFDREGGLFYTQSITMKDIISQLAEHDWYYHMSDDPSNFSRGRESEHNLRNELMKYEREHIVGRLEALIERVNKLYNQK